MSGKSSLLIVSNQNHSLILLISFCKVEKLEFVINSFLNLDTVVAHNQSIFRRALDYEDFSISWNVDGKWRRLKDHPVVGFWLCVLLMFYFIFILHSHRILSRNLAGHECSVNGSAMYMTETYLFTINNIEKKT